MSRKKMTGNKNIFLDDETIQKLIFLVNSGVYETRKELAKAMNIGESLLSHLLSKRKPVTDKYKFRIESFLSNGDSFVKNKGVILKAHGNQSINGDITGTDDNLKDKLIKYQDEIIAMLKKRLDDLEGNKR